MDPLLQSVSPMYLNDLAEELNDYKVVTYTDHRADSTVHYFKDYTKAFEHYKNKLLSINMDAKFTAGVAIIRTSTGEPVIRQSWRV